ncbi:MAG TPA: hypothetical protein PLE93_08150, partial [Solirubrobacterales bacterium]|nr:hypothetical protein [Solirubrobacterales bacterium]
MLAFALRRLGSMVLVLFAVSVLTFLIFNVLPSGDPAVRMAGKQPTETQIEAIREEWGFNEPVYVQYVKTMENLFSGNMISYFNAGTQWAVAKGNPENIAPDNACGKKIGVQKATVQVDD